MIYLETPTRHTGNWGLRSPLYSCKKLERSLESNEAEPTIFSCFNPDFDGSSSPPPHTHTSEHIFSGTNWESPWKVQKVRALRRAPGPRSVNADPSQDPESKSGPKWPGSGSRVRIRPIMAWIGTISWLRGYLFLSFIVNWPFFSIFMANGSWSGLVPTYVVSQSRLVVTQSGPDPATSRVAAPGLMPSI